MSTVRLNISYQGALDDIQQKRGMLEEALLAVFGELGDKLFELISYNLSGAVLKSQTGKLRSSLELEMAAFIGAVCGVAVQIPEDSESWLIGMVHEYGGKGYYTIEPINAQVLHWVGPEGGVFARHVNHPPALERSFMRSALAQMEADAVDQIRTTIEGVLAA